MPDIISINDVLENSPFDTSDTNAALNGVLRSFNRNEQPITTSGYPWLFKHRLIREGNVMLVEKNGVPQLVGPSAIPIRLKKIFNFRDSASVQGILPQSEVLIGMNGHYLVNVPPGKYAKIYEGNQAKLLGPGQHVIHSQNFRFDPVSDLIGQNEDVISHNDIHLIRVPQGKVAIVRVDNQTMFLEYRKEPYIFKTQQFNLQPSASGPFHDGNSKFLMAGTTIRLLPDVSEVGVINAGGRFDIIEPPSDQHGPIVKDIGNARFDGYLATSLQNVEFPSEEVKMQHHSQGVSPADANFDYFYTADQVKVGVRFFVSYRISNPDLTLETLQLADIRRHIEGVVTADMGNAIKKTSMHELLSSDMSTIAEGSTASPFTHWQDEVKSRLKEDLGSYGIELIRLNIEEAKILNPEIEAQMSQQAIAYASAHAQRSAMKAQLENQRAQAAQERELAAMRQETETQIMLKKTEAEVMAAQKTAEATRITADARQYQEEADVRVLSSHPAALFARFLTSFVEALRGGQFSAALPLSDLSNLLSTTLSQMNSLGSGNHNKNQSPFSFFNEHGAAAQLTKQGSEEQLSPKGEPLTH